MRTRLRPDEELLEVVRRHWIVLSGPCALTLFLLGSLIGAWFIRRPWVAPAVGIALACSGAWASWRWLDWRCDLWAVTSQRVIDESGVLSVRLIDSPLDKIHNVTCVQSLWGRLLGYGTLNVQTAAEVGSTTIEKVERPMELKETILDQQQKSRYQGMARQVAPLVAAAARAQTAAPAYGRPEATLAAGAGRPGAAAGDAAQDDTRECPHCAEIIKVRARVCRFCGRDV